MEEPGSRRRQRRQHYTPLGSKAIQVQTLAYPRSCNANAQYIRELMPAYVLFQNNKENKTPAEIFVQDHEKLVQEGAEWLKSTSESCSVVAALIAGVAFATTSAIPGAILTSRQQPRDFRRDLPLKLLIGLSSLFLAIASMLGSFSSSFFFLLKDRFHQVVLPLYAATCIPITFYAIAQLPLYADLLRAIFRTTPQSSNRESEKLIL
ncbi:ankyrin repeat-containing protein [Senna tora]|uniref:Ankyrin repeat-containing protein n=1 Tax=Senna tora TaxID=362788 RepID=A0A834WGD8_9FABA|nr:ankyrin repeat-containing protein [Senna tora]